MTLWHLSVWKLPSQFVLDNSRDPEDNCLGDMRSRYWDKLDHNITQSHTSPPGPASCRLVVVQVPPDTTNVPAGEHKTPCGPHDTYTTHLE